MIARTICGVAMSRLATCAALLTTGLLLAGCNSAGTTGNLFFDSSRIESPLGSYLAGRHARVERDTQAAVDFFSFALSEDPQNRTLQHRTFLLMLAEGNIEPALALAYSLALEPNTGSMSGLVLTIEDLRTGRYEAAADRLGAPPKRGFGALLKPLFLAWAHAGLGREDEAIEALALLGERDAFDVFQSFHAALIKDYLGNVEGARKAYEETRKKKGMTTSVALGYGSLLSRGGERKHADAIYRELLARSPDNPAVLAALAEIEAGRIGQPVVASVTDGVAQALFDAAGALARERGRDAARIYVHLALYMRPEFDAASMLLGDILERDQRWREAIDIYEKIAPNSPYYWEARIRVATSLDRIDKLDVAIETLTAMASDRADDTVAMVTLADLLRSHERYSEAATAYDQALSRLKEPKERHWALFYARGIALERNEEWDRAEADFLKALKLKPDQPLVLNYLGYSWIEQGRHVERAQKMIENAVAQRPNDGYIVDSLGWAHYRLNEYKRAVKFLERAVELKPQDPVINDHLGDAYWQVGRRIEARFQWSHALALEPDDSEIPKIKSKLDKGLASIARANGRS